MEPSNIANIGDLAKPVDTLIAKISDAVGVLYEPTRMRRLAKAEADSETIKALAGLSRETELKRTAQRLLAEETVKQQNAETIFQEAIPRLLANAKPQEIDNDWLLKFHEKSKLISEEQMRNIWSRLLASEANDPGSFSKRTLDLLSSMDKKDAEMFSSLCRYVWSSGLRYPVIFDVGHPIYCDFGITFAACKHLQSIGLIHVDTVTHFTYRVHAKAATISYFDSSFNVGFSTGTREREFPLGSIILTQFGQDLAPICDVEPIPNFVEYCNDEWRKAGIVISNISADERPTKTLIDIAIGGITERNNVLVDGGLVS